MQHNKSVIYELPFLLSVCFKFNSSRIYKNINITVNLSIII